MPQQIFLLAVINVWNSLRDVVSVTSLPAFKRSIRMVEFHEFLMCTDEQSFKATVTACCLPRTVLCLVLLCPRPVGGAGALSGDRRPSVRPSV